MSSSVAVVLAVVLGAPIGSLVALLVMGEISFPDLLWWTPSHRRRSAERLELWHRAAARTADRWRL